ncbi:malonyl-ACP O-methyltransferase BioC [Paramixta manurensis]|uniref:Malonyl-[acyl-carrier protein] O-methyltransferase n=1 Tax=Paramixta manurensis TaxID=2740817 RepID=A0A6M8UM94_9GAMM|nr:malonyl-ACP O-methyltransferase BioC [Erwiniaceae bacterium PD-1]
MTHKVNKQAVAQAFGRAAQSYDHHASLQRQSGEMLMALHTPTRRLSLLDAGCGTGWFSRRWRQQGHQVTALDLSSAMLAQAQHAASADHYLLGDIEALPLPENSVDLCWSNLAVQWCDDLSAAVGEMCRVTRPGGTVLFSTLSAASLSEVEVAWRAVDGRSHVNQFLSLAQIKAALQPWGGDLQQTTVVQAFPDVLAAMRSLKGIGATHLHQGRDQGVLTRERVRCLASSWPQDARGFLLSYHLVFGVINSE